MLNKADVKQLKNFVQKLRKSIISNYNFTIKLTDTFKREFQNIIYYIKYQLKQSMLANKSYNDVLTKILTLKFMLNRYVKLLDHDGKVKKLRKMYISNYLIIYEVNNDTRSSLYFTYISR